MYVARSYRILHAVQTVRPLDLEPISSAVRMCRCYPARNLPVTCAQVSAAIKHHAGNMQLVRDYDGFARITQLLQWAALTFADDKRPDGPAQRTAGHEVPAQAQQPVEAGGAEAVPGPNARELQVRVMAADKACGPVCIMLDP